MSECNSAIRSSRTTRIALQAFLFACSYTIIAFSPTSIVSQTLNTLIPLLDSALYDSALTLVDRELEEDSLRGVLWIYRDSVLAVAGRTGDRISSFERAVAIWPHGIPFRVRLAGLLIDEGQAARARSHLEIALDEPSGGTWRGHYLSGRVYEMEGVYDSAVAAYNRAWTLLRVGILREREPTGSEHR